MKKYIVLFLLLISTILFARVRPGTSNAIVLYGENTYGFAQAEGGSEIEWSVCNNSDTSIRAEATVRTESKIITNVYYLSRFNNSEPETTTGSGNGYPYYYDLSLSVDYGWLIGNHCLGAWLIYHASSWDDNSEYL